MSVPTRGLATLVEQREQREPCLPLAEREDRQKPRQAPTLGQLGGQAEARAKRRKRKRDG